MDENGNQPNADDLALGGGQPQPDEPTGNEPTGTPQDQPQPGEQPEEQEQEEEPEISRDPVNPEQSPEQEEEEPQPVSRRESKRVNQLLEKLARYEQGQMQPQGSQPQGQTPRQPNGQIIPEGEYSIDQVNDMAQDYGQRLYQMGLSQAQAYNIANTFATRLEIDAPKVGGRYEFLDSDNEENFNPGAADFINRMYLNTVGYDPMTGVVRNQDLRYGEFVDGFMDVVQLVAQGKVADAAQNVARQSAQRGVRPGDQTKKATYQGNDPKQMSDEQLDAAIAAGLGIRPK